MPQQGVPREGAGAPHRGWYGVSLIPCSPKEGSSSPNQALPDCYAGYAPARGGSPPNSEPPHHGRQCPRVGGTGTRGCCTSRCRAEPVWGHPTARRNTAHQGLQPYNNTPREPQAREGPRGTWALQEEGASPGQPRQRGQLRGGRGTAAGPVCECNTPSGPMPADTYPQAKAQEFGLPAVPSPLLTPSRDRSGVWDPRPYLQYPGAPLLAQTHNTDTLGEFLAAIRSHELCDTRPNPANAELPPRWERDPGPPNLPGDQPAQLSPRQLQHPKSPRDTGEVAEQPQEGARARRT